MIEIGNNVYNVDLIDILEDLRAYSKGNYFSKGFKKTEKSIGCQCPFHKDGKESKISSGFLKESNTFHCFTCNKNYYIGEVITYITDEKPYVWLNKRYNGVRKLSTSFEKTVERKTNRKLIFNLKKEKTYLEESELDKYRQFHPYMFERGLTKEIIKRFKIGYDKESDSIVFPIRDEKGRLLFVAKRSVKSKFFNYPENVEKPLYALDEIYKDLYNGKEIEEIYIVESILDALTVWKYGKHAIALNGLGTEKQYKMIEKLPFRSIILALDNDEHGQKGCSKIKNKVNKLFYKVEYPAGKKDMNDLSEQEFINLEKRLYV